jgi:hypothetical protein
MSAIASQFEDGVEQAMAQLGVTATYQRCDTSATLSLTVILATPEYQIAGDTSIVMVAADKWDVLLMTADLAFSGTAYDPSIGDTLTINNVVYGVMLDDVRRNCWTWADKFRIRRRVFTKIMSGE